MDIVDDLDHRQFTESTGRLGRRGRDSKPVNRAYLIGIACRLVSTAQIRRGIEQDSDLLESGRLLMDHMREPDIFAELCAVTQN